jgi:hypothetical protein
VILSALSYGMDGHKDLKPSNGAIYRLLKKLDSALEFVQEGDIDSIKKIADTYLKLAALAMPTAAQAEAIDKGINPSNTGLPVTNVLLLIESHLEKRRALLTQSIPTESVVIESIPTLSELAKSELSKRHASLTPPPDPGLGDGVEKNGGRGPTVSNLSPTGISGTKQVDEAIKELPRETVDMEDLDFS